MNKIKGRFARYYKLLPGKSPEHKEEYSLNKIKVMWGIDTVNKLLRDGKVQIGYYEWLELEVD